MIGDTIKTAVFTSWKTTATGFLGALAMVLAETGTDVAHINKYQLAKAGTVFFLGFFAKDADKSHTQQR